LAAAFRVVPLNEAEKDASAPYVALRVDVPVSWQNAAGVSASAAIARAKIVLCCFISLFAPLKFYIVLIVNVICAVYVPVL